MVIEADVIMDDVTIVSEMTLSCQRQLAWYRELLSIDQKALSAIILSRGGLPQIMNMHERKSRLLDSIISERTSMAAVVERWQERKSAMDPSGPVSQLNAILGEMEGIIRDFLGCEDQLKRHLSHLVTQKKS